MPSRAIHFLRFCLHASASLVSYSFRVEQEVDIPQNLDQRAGVTYWWDTEKAVELSIPVSTISIACFISSFLYKETILDLGTFVLIRIFRKYLWSNFLNLKNEKQHFELHMWYISMHIFLKKYFLALFLKKRKRKRKIRTVPGTHSIWASFTFSNSYYLHISLNRERVPHWTDYIQDQLNSSKDKPKSEQKVCISKEWVRPSQAQPQL